MDIFDWYFKQIVTQGQMDWAFDRVQSAMYGISVDNDMVGIVDGLTVTQHAPTPDKNVDIAGPGTAFDKSGQRCYVPDLLSVVDCSQDEFGTDSNPPTATYQRYISVFLRFNRNLTDPALDGNNIQVYTKQLESFELFVRLGAEAAPASAVPPPLMDDAILLVDILVTNGFTAIVNGDMDFSRREDWVRFLGSVLGSRVYGTAKEGLEDVLALIESWGGALPFSFGATWFGSVAVAGSSPPPATMQDALNAIVFDLAKAGATPAGTEHIGALDSPAWTYVTNWASASLAAVLASLGGDLNSHIGGAAPYHPASAITFAAYSFLTSTDVQAAMQEMIDDLALTTGTPGATRIGGGAISDSPTGLAGGTLTAQITALLAAINDRARIASAETITANWIFDAIIRLADEGAYVRGEETTSGHYFPIFRHSSLRGGIWYSGSSGAIAIAYNCYWDSGSSVWKYILSNEHSYVLMLSSSGLYLEKMDKDDPNHISGGWTDLDWTGNISLGSDTSGTIAMNVFALAGSTSGFQFYDRVRYALHVYNTGTASHVMTNHCACTWHAKMPSALVSGDITVSPDSQTNWSGTPSVVGVDSYGCTVSDSCDAIAQYGQAWNYGSLELDMTV